MKIVAYYHEEIDGSVTRKSVGLERRETVMDEPLVLERDALARIGELEREARNDSVAYRAAIERQNELRAELAALKAQEPVLPSDLDLASAQLRADRELALGSCARDIFYFALIECLRANKLYAALSVSAQPAGEVPEVVAYEHVLHMELGQKERFFSEIEELPFGVKGEDFSATYDVISEPLMTVTQHTRIVAALQSRAVVMPERIRCDNYTKVDLGSKNFKAGFNFALDEVARLNGGQVDPLEWSRKHGIEEY